VAKDIDHTGGGAGEAEGHCRPPSAIPPAGLVLAAALAELAQSEAAHRKARGVSRPDAVAGLAAERVAELRRQIDYLVSTVALLPLSPRRAAARAAVQAIERDIAELLRHLGVDDPRARPPIR
jgi:hypothetical protein